MATTTLPESVTLTDGPGGLPVVRVATPLATATVHLDGAHVTEWTPAGEKQVLFLSTESDFAAGAPIRGGVPICGPWFAKGKNGDKVIQHGFLRLARWELADATDDAGTVRLTFTLDVAAAAEALTDPAEKAAAEPYAEAGVTATYVVTVGSELDMALTYETKTDIELEVALHSYLAVGDITTLRIEGLHEARYIDKAPGGRAVNAQSGDVVFTRETDRIYASEADVRVVDDALGRTLVVAKSGSASTVIWNPWEAKAAGLADLGDAEWKTFVCVETANVVRQAFTLAAGESHTTTQHLSVVHD